MANDLRRLTQQEEQVLLSMIRDKFSVQDMEQLLRGIRE
jgi:hypothetical protein